MADSFAIGATRDEVRRIQGPPHVVEHLNSLGVEVWTWRTASVRFALADGRLDQWTDAARELRVRVDAPSRALDDTVSIGTSVRDLVRLAGRPIAVSRKDRREYWWYGRSLVVIDAASRRVRGWREDDRRLPVRVADGPAAGEALGGVPTATYDRPSAKPASLTVSAVLRDTSRAARTTGARNAIVVTVRNDGEGTAFGVMPTLHLETGGAAPLETGASSPISSLGPGARVVRDLVFELPEAAADTTVTIAVTVSEVGTSLVHVGARVRVPVIAAPRPMLTMDELRIDDQSGDGRLSPREIADVTARLRNDGPQPARGAWATLSLGRDVFAAAGTPARFELGTIPAGASIDLTFSVYTNTRAESLGVWVDVHGPSNARVTRIPISLPLERAAPVAPATPTGAWRRATGSVDDALPWRATPDPDALAVVIGIDRYRRVPPARFAARDAASWRRYAVDAFGVPNDAEHLYVRLDADATGGEMRKALGETGWLARRAGPQSDVYVFFAGHGAAATNGEPLILPWDADPNYPSETALRLAAVYAALARLPARTITVVLDACFSGLSRGNVPITEGGRPIVVSVEHPALLRRGMAVFAAARDAETAGELPEARHGLFTTTFLRALRGDGDADGDGAVTVDELDRYLAREVPAAAAAQDREQHPLVIARDRSRVVVRARP